MDVVFVCLLLKGQLAFLLKVLFEPLSLFLQEHGLVG